MNIDLKEPVNGLRSAEVKPVSEIIQSACTGCCFYRPSLALDIIAGIYSTPEQRCNAEDHRLLECGLHNVIFVANTEEGRAAYVAAKMVEV